MEAIQSERVQRALGRYAGREVYLHFEFPQGGFMRNVKARVIEIALRGEGPFRVGIHCEEDGWVVVDDLTHWAAAEGEPLFLCGVDADQRLSQALQIHLEPMEA